MNDMPDLDHVLLTRFNLPTGGAEQQIRARDGWLNNRVQLFENYCLPSVQAQTSTAFHWIIYFDPESPDWLRQAIARWAEHGTFRPVFRASVSRVELISDLCETVGTGNRRLLTTNLDNDDAIAADFVEILQRATVQSGRRALYMTRGLIIASNRAYLRVDRRNAFCSVEESWSDPVTCWADWHNLLGKHMQIVELQGPPAWIQVVHGRNVSNRIHGRLISPSKYLKRFPHVLTALKDPPRLFWLWDTLAMFPARGCRDHLRRAAKSVAMALLGKHGVERMRDLLRAQRIRPRGSA